MSEGAPPLSRTAYVLQRLREDLASGEVSPGQPLRQTAIAQRYGVSPTPVREALRILAADGVIAYESHRGATVRDYTPSVAYDLYRMRAEAEGLACELSVPLLTAEDRSEVHAAAMALDEARASGATPEQLSILNRQFHFTIYKRCSDVMQEFLNYVWIRFKPSVTLWGDASVACELEKDHARILRAIDEGDAAAAGQATREHIMHACTIRQGDQANTTA